MASPCYRKLYGTISVMLLLATFAFAQDAADTSHVRALVDKAERYNAAFTAEKIYLKFDKPYYAAGDTAWFKGYVLHHNKASGNSAKLYVELLNSHGELIQRLTLPVSGGLATGYFPLDSKTIAEGSYTIRAYTNWQQNFGPESFFYKQFDVGKLGGKTWLVNEQNRNDNPADTNHVQLAMRFTDAKGLPLVTRKLTVRVLENARPLLKSELTTGVDGTLSGNFTLPAKVDRRALSIAVEDANDKEQHITFPFYPSGYNGDIDLQFMPEGGSLIGGVYNKIGFKAIGEDGLGREIKGTVVNSKGEEVANLQSLHNGMGSFVLVPQPEETYMAKIWVNGKQRSYRLPAAKAQGIALRVDGVTHAGELYLYVTSSVPDDKGYILIARSADKVYMGSAFKLNADNYFNTRIKKSMFPTGIIELMVLGANNTVLNQRRVFVDHHDALQITAMAGQTAYRPKDSVSLDLHAIDKDGQPVQGSFSVAITDDAQVKDAIQPDNIQSHILLASELKGNIETPAWYFEKGDEQLKEKALDNLLLTQGWQGFDRSKIEAGIPTTAFQPEPDNNISGHLKTIMGKPAPGLKVSLLAHGKQMYFQDTVSDTKGDFVFSDLPVTDSVAYLIKLHDKKGRTSTAGITVNEFQPTAAALKAMPRLTPWNMNTDTTLINYINNSGKYNKANDAFIPPGNGKVLKQVDIKAQRITKYVGGEFAVELTTITEKELMAARKVSVLELLYKKFPGLHESNFYAQTVFDTPRRHQDAQFVNGLMLVNDIIADGVSVSDPIALQEDVTAGGGGVIAAAEVKPGQPNLSSRMSKQDAYDNLKNFLNSLGGEDVKSVSLYRGTQLFLVVETRSGKGPYARQSLGTYVYRPPVVQLPKQFYSPKYTVKNDQPDMRSTIHWEPNAVTDAKGDVKIALYAASSPGTYTVFVEGTDMQGHFGVTSSKITIAPAQASVKP